MVFNFGVFVGQPETTYRRRTGFVLPSGFRRLVTAYSTVMESFMKFSLGKTPSESFNKSFNDNFTTF